MSLFSLLYVSRSTIPPAQAAAAVDDIVAQSHSRNSELGITGALLFTGVKFAQVLEGSEASVDTLFASILRDERHKQIVVVARDPIAKRRFDRWSMAYSGPSQFVSRHVTRLLSDPSIQEQGRSVMWLNELLWEFAEGPGAAT